VAKENNVPDNILPNRDAIITQKTVSTNILVLRDNANTDTFYQEQIDRIMKAKPGDGGKDTPPTERINKASLDTKTKLPLKNEEDINRYLSGLREQLMKKLVNYDGVMIIK
jgi:hypothetical protein